MMNDDGEWIIYANSFSIYSHERMVIVIDVYIKNNMLKNKNPKLLKTLPPSFPMS